MKISIPLVITLSLLLFVSCTQKQPNVYKELGINKEDTYLLFFSNKNAYKKEEPYYDALFELKNSYQEEMEEIKIITSNKGNYYRDFNIKTSPAIILLRNEEILCKIDGTATKEQIIHFIIDNIHTN